MADSPFNEATAKIAAQQQRIKALERHLRALCYQPGTDHGFVHIDYCRWCHYAKGHPHHPNCIMADMEKSDG